MRDIVGRRPRNSEVSIISGKEENTPPKGLIRREKEETWKGEGERAGVSDHILTRKDTSVWWQRDMMRRGKDFETVKRRRPRDSPPAVSEPIPGPEEVHHATLYKLIHCWNKLMQQIQHECSVYTIISQHECSTIISFGWLTKSRELSWLKAV